MAEGGAGASLTVPVRAGELKKGHYVVISGQPAKVIELTTSKTGKHGHAKANITALNIFNGNKLQDICPTSHNMEKPVVAQSHWTLIDLDETLHCTLLNEEGETDETQELDPEKYAYHQTIKEAFEADGEVEVRLVSAMGTTVVMPKTGGDGMGL